MADAPFPTPVPADLGPSGAAARPGVVVLTAHPQMEHSRINRRLMTAAQQVTRRGAGVGVGVAVRDLYALYPDYLIDIAAEQALLASAELIVWQHPVQWYSMPALMKLWVDEVLSFGWAYGPGGTALRGKDLWLVATTGGPRESYHPDSYNRYDFNAFLPAYRQTAQLCGMRFLPPLVLYGAHRAGEPDVQAHLDHYTQRLASYPHWGELDTLLYDIVPPVPPDTRPDDTAALTPFGTN